MTAMEYAASACILIASVCVLRWVYLHAPKDPPRDEFEREDRADPWGW